jgi:hypothetical protein
VHPPYDRVAVWAGLTTFFTAFASLKLIHLVGNDANTFWQAGFSLVTAASGAVAVYAKQKLDDERARRGDG